MARSVIVMYIRSRSVIVCGVFGVLLQRVAEWSGVEWSATESGVLTTGKPTCPNVLTPHNNKNTHGRGESSMVVVYCRKHFFSSWPGHTHIVPPLFARIYDLSDLAVLDAAAGGPALFLAGWFYGRGDDTAQPQSARGRQRHAQTGAPAWRL